MGFKHTADGFKRDILPWLTAPLANGYYLVAGARGVRVVTQNGPVCLLSALVMAGAEDMFSPAEKEALEAGFEHWAVSVYAPTPQLRQAYKVGREIADRFCATSPHRDKDLK